MKRRPPLILLDEPGHGDGIHVLCGRVELADGQRRSTENILRTFSFPDDPFYGRLEVTPDMLQQMVRNFEADVYGQRLAVNIAHMDSEGAAGFIQGLSVSGDRLMAEVEWTDLGMDAIRNKGFRYFSSEYVDEYKHPETEQRHGALLMGAALTIRPRVKRLDPIDPDRLTLSEQPGAPRYVLSSRVATLLSEEVGKTMKKHLDALRKQLEAKKLSEPVITAILAAAEQAMKALGEDDAALTALVEKFGAAGAQLAEQVGQTPVTLDIRLPEGGAAALSEAQVQALVSQGVEKALADHATAQKKLTEDLEARRSQFRELMEKAEGLKALSEDQRKVLLEAEALITAAMTEDQVKALAEHQIALGNQMAVSAQLAARGFPAPGGQVHISVDESNAIRELQELVDKRLGLAGMSDARRYARTGGQLQPENKALAEKVLEQFDQERGEQLRREAASVKRLAAGTGTVTDVAVPSIFERTVIREALYTMVALNFVNADSMRFGHTVNIPYSYRDTSAAGRSSTRTYEGQGIARAGVVQTSENVYPLPQKLSFLVSDELSYLTGASEYNWDAVSENQRNAQRIINEDLEHIIANELLHAADEYGAVAVANEDLEPQADDVKTIFVTAQFPIARPRKVYDLKGNQIGSTVNPITVSYNSVALEAYDGTGTQSAGTYYVLDHNLGEIYLVDESGAVQTPANGTAYTISYTYVTNVVKWDTDDPSGVDTDVHWDDFLYRFGLRKSVIEDDRYHMTNFSLMSGTVLNQIEQARRFGANFRRPGTDLMADGNLGRIKDVPASKIIAPGLWMGDQRVIIGERGVTRFRMLKAWMMGELENARDANGKFTGQKEAYGDQFIALFTPTQLKRALTSMVLYSATARVAR